MNITLNHTEKMSFLKRLTVYRYSVYNEVKELELYIS